MQPTAASATQEKQRSFELSPPAAAMYLRCFQPQEYKQGSGLVWSQEGAAVYSDQPVHFTGESLIVANPSAAGKHKVWYQAM